MNQNTATMGLKRTALWMKDYLSHKNLNMEERTKWSEIIARSMIENQWFTLHDIEFTLNAWAEFVLSEGELLESIHTKATGAKRVGIIPDENVPLAGLGAVIATVLSGNIPVLKLPTKNKRLLPLFLDLWRRFSEAPIPFEVVDRLNNIHAVIARSDDYNINYLKYYFNNIPNIIYSKKVSIAVLNGKETDHELQNLATDLFRYFGLSSGNVRYLLIPENFELRRLFENFGAFKDLMLHYKYSNNYEYNRAVYLMNLQPFFDNNFVMLRESSELFPPIGTIHFTRYKESSEIKSFVSQHREKIDHVGGQELNEVVNRSFGTSLHPSYERIAQVIEFLNKMK